MKSYAYYNGDFGEARDIRIPLSDRAIYFGDGIYDAAIGRGDKIFQASEHIARFIANAKRIGICNVPSHEQIHLLLRDVVKRSDIDEFFLYFQISRSAPYRSHSASASDGINLLITVTESEITKSSSPISLITVPDNRYYMCDIKTVNLLPAVLASTQAELAGADEAVFHRDNTVTECAHSNIAILKSGTLFTHPLSNTILPGITRRHLLLACEKLEIPYRERAFTLDDLYSSDEVFVTSTSKLCRCAGKVNGIPVGGKDRWRAEKICGFLYEEYRAFCDFL